MWSCRQEWWKAAALTVEGTRIAANEQAEQATLDLAGQGLTIVPGFVDLHNHGGGGASFTSGTAEDILTGVRTHREHGTTTLVASTVTENLETLVGPGRAALELVEQGDLAGIHFEGPFISPCRKGAHDEGLLRHPDPVDVRKLVEAARGAAKMLTLAAELPGGIESVRLLADLGVIAAIGHTDATYEQTRQAIDAGATVATHLFNAMPPLQHRTPGPIAALLEDERVTVELINDGTHLHPSILELAFDSAGADRVAFITDAMDAAGFGDGMYDLGPMKVEVLEGVARLVEGGSIMRLHAHPGHRVPAGRDPRRALAHRHRTGHLDQPGPAARPGRPDRHPGARQGRRPGGPGRGVRPGRRHAQGRVGGPARLIRPGPRRALGDSRRLPTRGLFRRFIAKSDDRTTKGREMAAGPLWAGRR